MKIENWCGYKIRFIEIDGEWWAFLKDICDALGLRSDRVASRLSSENVAKTKVEITSDLPSQYVKKDTRISSTGNKRTQFTKMISVLVVNELGIYEALYSSRKPEAQKFKKWSAEVMKKLRSAIGLKGYEALKLTDPSVQDQIDHLLNNIFWDENRQQTMISITVAGGDVEQIPFDDYSNNSAHFHG